MKQMHGKMKLQRTKQYSLTLDFHAATFRDVLRHEIENKPLSLFIYLESK